MTDLAMRERDEVRAIEQLLSDYCEYLDTGDIEKWAACYTDDGTFHGLKGEVQGREALAAYGRRATERGFFLHFLTNVRIRLDPANRLEATASSYLLYTHGEDGHEPVIVAARQQDRLSKVDGRWRIAHRRIEGRPLLSAF